MVDEWDPDWPLPEEYRSLDPDGLRRAISDAQQRIHIDITDAESYHLLFHLWIKAEQYDKAWCLAGLVASFDRATRTEGLFYRDHTVEDLIEPKRRLSHEDWVKYLVSEDQDPILSQVFGTLYAAAGDALYSEKRKKFGITDKHRLDLTRPTVLTRTIGKTADMLGIDDPPVYGHEKGRAMRCLPTWPMILAVGPDMLSGRTQTEIKFLAAKSLAYFHMWHPMAALYEPNQLNLILLAAARAVSPDEASFRHELPPEVEQQLTTLELTLRKKLPEPQKEVLAKAMKVYASGDRKLDPGQWDCHVELTANHAAIYVTDDIEMCGRFIRNEVSNLSPLDTRTKVEDFVRFVLSDRFHELRREMEIEVEL